MKDAAILAKYWKATLSTHVKVNSLEHCLSLSFFHFDSLHLLKLKSCMSLFPPVQHFFFFLCFSSLPSAMHDAFSVHPHPKCRECHEAKRPRDNCNPTCNWSAFRVSCFLCVVCCLLFVGWSCCHCLSVESMIIWWARNKSGRREKREEKGRGRAKGQRVKLKG